MEFKQRRKIYFLCGSYFFHVSRKSQYAIVKLVTYYFHQYFLTKKKEVTYYFVC